MTAIDRLLAIMDRLRDPVSGCPWDREQSFQSIVPHTLEEAHEVADVIERGRFEELPGELGDLLFQVVFYARLGKERGWFDFQDVVGAISDKLERRHPHVFANAAVSDARPQSLAWEALKKEERQERDTNVLDGVALALPALARAAKLQKRAARVGFDWPALAPVLEKVAEELEELRAALAGTGANTPSELGDLLFACVNVARHAGIDPEQALRGANRRFERRFRYMETRLQGSGRDISTATPEEMDALWREAKRAESEPGAPESADTARADNDRYGPPGRCG